MLIYARYNYLKKYNMVNVMKKVCWYCCHSFDGVPLHIPCHYDENKDIFTTEGYFCSWECMKSWNLYDKNDSFKNIRFTLISLMYQKNTNDFKNSINFAPVKTNLKMFGGSMDINEFRKNNITVNEYVCPIIPLPKTNDSTSSIKIKKKCKQKEEFTLVNSMGITKS